jgi:hypothetical protein
VRAPPKPSVLGVFPCCSSADGLVPLSGRPSMCGQAACQVWPGPVTSRKPCWLGAARPKHAGPHVTFSMWLWDLKEFLFFFHSSLNFGNSYQFDYSFKILEINSVGFLISIFIHEKYKTKK